MPKATPRDHRVQIVTDTTASLPSGYAAAHALEVVPQVIIFGDDSYLETREMDFARFIRRLKSSSILPKTAAPPPGEFVATYERALSQADTVLSIHPSSEVSGTVRSAQTAKETAFAEADIRILDTRTIGAGLGAMVQVAVEAAEAGRTADEIMARLDALIPRSRTYFAIQTLEYLQRGGRIGRAAALTGELLRIKPLLQLTDGEVAPLEKVRTHRRALQRLRDLTVQGCLNASQPRLAIMEADALADAHWLAAECEKALALDQVPIVGVGSAITTHAGPGVVGVSFIQG